MASAASSFSPKVISSYEMIGFDSSPSVGLGAYWSGFPEAMERYITGLISNVDAAKKASMIFSNVIITGSALIALDPSPGVRHAHWLDHFDGPFTADQFLKIVQFKGRKEISFDAWRNYIQTIQPKAEQS